MTTMTKTPQINALMTTPIGTSIKRVKSRLMREIGYDRYGLDVPEEEIKRYYRQMLRRDLIEACVELEQTSMLLLKDLRLMEAQLNGAKRGYKDSLEFIRRLKILVNSQPSVLALENISEIPDSLTSKNKGVLPLTLKPLTRTQSKLPKRIDGSKAKLNQLNKENQSLRNALDEDRSNIAKLEDEIDTKLSDMRKENEDLLQTIDKERSNVAHLEEEISHTEAKLLELTKENDQLHTVMEDDRANIARLERHMKAAEERIENLGQENETLRKELAEDRTNLSHLENEVEHLRRNPDIEKWRVKAQIAETNLIMVNNNMEDMKQELDREMTNREQLESQVSRMKNMLYKQRDELDRSLEPFGMTNHRSPVAKSPSKTKTSASGHRQDHHHHSKAARKTKPTLVDKTRPGGTMNRADYKHNISTVNEL